MLCKCSRLEGDDSLRREFDLSIYLILAQLAKIIPKSNTSVLQPKIIRLVSRQTGPRVTLGGHSPNTRIRTRNRFQEETMISRVSQAKKPFGTHTYIPAEIRPALLVIVHLEVHT